MCAASGRNHRFAGRYAALICACIVIIFLAGTAAASSETRAPIPAQPEGDATPDPGSREDDILANAKLQIERILTGKVKISADSIGQALDRIRGSVKAELTDLLFRLCFPVLAGLVLKAALGASSGMCTGAELLCRLCCARVMLAAFVSAGAAASDLLQKAVEAVRSVAPFLATALTVTGGSSLLSPAAALYAGVVEKALGDYGLSLCTAAAAIAAAGNLSSRFSLNRFFALIKCVTSWLIGLGTASFIGLLSASTLSAVAQDTVAGRTARYAVSNMIPIIGRRLSGILESIAGSTSVIRGALGLTGTSMLLFACAGPMLKLAASTLSMKLAAAIIEPVSDRGIASMVSQFSNAAEMLLSICIAGIVMGILTVGAMLTALGMIVGTGA